MKRPRRLDVELVERGLAESREQAQRLILAGEVWVEGQRWDKASKLCAAVAAIEVRGGDRYVSRGGHKLEGALTGFHLDVTGWRCLDLGASTGGFTDCLLQHGAREVVAVDVGHGQLHWRLRQDPRVIVHEGVNARDLAGFAQEHFPGTFDLVVADVSFISLRKVLPPAFDLLSSGGRVCALIKPQFEAGRAEVGKGGIVRDAAVRRAGGGRPARVGGGLSGDDGGRDPLAAAGPGRKRGIFMAAAKKVNSRRDRERLEAGREGRALSADRVRAGPSQPAASFRKADRRADRAAPACPKPSWRRSRTCCWSRAATARSSTWSRRSFPSQVPILGVNIGSLGFLTAVAETEVETILPYLADNDLLLSPAPRAGDDFSSRQRQDAASFPAR